MEIEIISECCEVCVEINPEEMPKILIADSQKLLKANDAQSFSDTKSPKSSEESPDMFPIELEQRAEIIRKLQSENIVIIKDRNELAEEYEEEIKAIQIKNYDYEKENYKMKQVVEKLYNHIDEMQANQENIAKSQQRNLELEAALMKNDKILKALNETNKMLLRSLPEHIEKTEDITDNSSTNTIENLLLEKNKLIKKIVDMDTVYIDSITEKDELKNELIMMKLKYAESETKKNEIYYQIKEKSKKKKIN